jgi:hypothetical protein
MKEYPSKCLYNNATLHNCKQKSIYW